MIVNRSTLTPRAEIICGLSPEARIAACAALRREFLAYVARTSALRVTKPVELLRTIDARCFTLENARVGASHTNTTLHTTP